MNIAAPVRVHWSEEKRNRLPTSGQYIGVARFAQDRANWPSSAWSVVLDIHGDPGAQPCMADARFLAAEAPQERLRPGACFELLEGHQVTAIVEVV